MGPIPGNVVCVAGAGTACCRRHELFAIRSGPGLPEPGESKRRGVACGIAFGAYEIGTFRTDLLPGLPLIKTISRDQAAPSPQRATVSPQVFVGTWVGTQRWAIANPPPGANPDQPVSITARSNA